MKGKVLWVLIPAILLGLVAYSQAQRVSQEDWCRNYANKTIEQVKERVEIDGSVPSNDSVWSQDWRLHYNWCMSGSNVSRCEREVEKRQKWLTERRVRAEGSGKRPEALPDPIPGPGGRPGALPDPIPRPTDRPGALPDPIPRPVKRPGALPDPIPQPIERTSSFSRRAAIKALMANQSSRRALESLSASAGLKPEQLTTKTLQGNNVSGIKEIDDLAWDEGIRLSLTKNVPMFYDGNRYRRLGELTYEDVILCTYDDMEENERDIFRVRDYVRLRLRLPRQTGAYMIAVTTDARPREVYLSDQNGKKKLTMVRGNTPSTWLCVTTIHPRKYGEKGCDITVYPGVTLGGVEYTDKGIPQSKNKGSLIGGFTITRL